MAHRMKIRHPKTSKPVSLTPRQVAAAYGFPIRAQSGKGYTGGLIELGGGFKETEVAEYFTANGLPVPTFVSVPVAGGKNKPDGADGEVQLDMIVFGAIAPNAVQRVYFAKNTDAGFLAALKQAVTECDGVSISWGGSENNWDPKTMDAFEAVIKDAKDNGVPVFVAAGDTGSQDSSNDGNQVDFPASSPSAIGCGGTRLTVNPMTTPDPVATTQVLVTARQELLAYANALNGPVDGLRQSGPAHRGSDPAVGDRGHGGAEPFEDGMAASGVDPVSF